MTGTGTPILTTALIPGSADRPGDDPIFALHAEAARRAGAGNSVLDATIGALMEDDGRLAIMPSVYEAIRRVEPERAAAYAPISGPPDFLAAVIRDLYDGSVLAQNALAVATPGGTGAVHHAIVNFLEPGQRLLTSSYYWGPYRILAEHTRRGIETFEMFDGGGRLDLDAFERALSRLVDEQGRALIVLNSPCHNPTGYSFDDGEWKRLVEIVGAAGERAPTALLLDAAYARFGSSMDWVRQVEPLLGRATLLVAWTASKAFAQYGSRIGALVAAHPDPDERLRIKNALGYSCRGTWSNCNHLGMLAITELLTDPVLSEHSRRQRDRLRGILAERVAAFNELASEAGLSYPRYEGGFFVAVFTSNAIGTSERMKEEGVFVVPLEGAVRVALCATPKTDVPRLVQALERGVRAAGG
ncbi:MAG: aminotransferase class I/II-fold pyridoxal phosphate-dependent enzyme [Planctomycetota bacterium]|nr:aminotransferase class I/II-fold pyridoxal phosphate-dependent enzyme [Planctomycetota bacterium]